jgi:methylmalonyl-CoA mutase
LAPEAAHGILLQRKSSAGGESVTMTSESPGSIALAAEFPAATREMWLALVTAALKGAPFDQKLTSRSYDGVAIAPLYDRDSDALPMAGRAPATPWQIMQRIDHPDPAAANAEARHELMNGAAGLTLVLASSAGAHGYGLPATEAAIAQALAGIHLDAGIAIEFDQPAPTAESLGLAARVVRSRGIAPAATRIRFGFDPLGAMAATGRAGPDDIAQCAAVARDLAGAGFGGPFLAADGRPVHAAGGSEAQELAFVLAVATASLRALEACGIALDEARRMLFFRLAADADQFLTMAKFRALRRLWGRIEEACGLAPRPAVISAETAWRMMTRRDPYVNILRSTVAVFAAGLAGADAIAVLPFTAALGLPDRFARRMARNSQLILLEESNLARVTDPAAGSGAIEDLTGALCRSAWALFQEIEAAGGAAAALATGLIQRKVAAVRAERIAAVAHRKDALTGTSEFPHLAEIPPTVLDVAPAAPSAVAAPAACEPLPALRLAEPYERLRDASDRLLAAAETRPKIFLANLGPLADFTARATFAKNFFGAGGIEAVGNDGFDGHDSMVAAFRAAGTPFACLCSSDEVYGREAVAAAQVLAAAGAKRIYLAGRPGELAAALAAAGVTDFIHAGCDVVATLEAAHRAI